MPTANKSLSPTLRFPEFRRDGEWAERPLGNISTRIRKKVGTKVLTPVSITAGLGFVDQTAKFGRRIAGEQYKNYIHIKRGDFVYNKGNSKTFAQGCIYQLKEFDEAAASTAFICFKLDDRCVDQYFQSLFEFNAHGRELAKFITSGARSDGLLNINPNDFFSIELPVPPQKAEQQKIADCLGSLDDLIAAHSRKLAALQDHKKGLLQQLFPAEGETTPKRRFPGFEGEWILDDFEKAAFFQEGPGIMKADFHNEGIPLVRLSGLVGATVSLDGCNYLDPEKVTEKWEHFRLIAGDLLVSCSASFGRPTIVNEIASGAVFYTGLVRFRPKDKRLRAGYLEAFLGSPCFMKQAESFAVGGGIKHFGPTHLKQMEIPLPCSEEQQKIADCLSALDALITAQTEQVAALKAHKKGLMQQLFPNPGGQ